MTSACTREISGGSSRETVSKACLMFLTSEVTYQVFVCDCSFTHCVTRHCVIGLRRVVQVTSVGPLPLPCQPYLRCRSCSVVASTCSALIFWMQLQSLMRFRHPVGMVARTQLIWWPVFVAIWSVLALTVSLRHATSFSTSNSLPSLASSLILVAMCVGCELGLGAVVSTFLGSPAKACHIRRPDWTCSTRFLGPASAFAPYNRPFSTAATSRTRRADKSPWYIPDRSIYEESD
jgi:hypothetical protein